MVRQRGDDINNYLKPSVESEVQHVAQSYKLPIIEACVKAGLESLPDQFGIQKDTTLVMKGIEGLMDPGTSQLNESQYEKAKRRGIMDWSIYLLTEGEEKRYITVGETKLDSKWTSSWLPRRLGGAFENQEAQWPLRQTAKYCYTGNTGWCFLYTPKETVLCRFYIIPENNGRVNTSKTPWFGLKWKSVPMQPEIPHNPLGAIIGIWSWIMFAFLDEDRALKTRDKLRPLSDLLPDFSSISANSKHSPGALSSEESFKKLKETPLETQAEGLILPIWLQVQRLHDQEKYSEADTMLKNVLNWINLIQSQLKQGKLKRKSADDTTDAPRKRVLEGGLSPTK